MVAASQGQGGCDALPAFIPDPALAGGGGGGRGRWREGRQVWGSPGQRGQAPKRPTLSCRPGHSCFSCEPLVTLLLPSEKPGQATVTLGMQWRPARHLLWGTAPLARCPPETSSQLTVSQSGCRWVSASRAQRVGGRGLRLSPRHRSSRGFGRLGGLRRLWHLRTAAERPEGSGVPYLLRLFDCPVCLAGHGRDPGVSCARGCLTVALALRPCRAGRASQVPPPPPGPPR